MGTSEDPSRAGGRPAGAGSDAPGSTRTDPANPPATTVPGAAGEPTAAEPARRRGRRDRADNMLPGRERRRSRLERLLVRLIATGGVIGIGVALGAILTSNKVSGWIIGLVIALVTVVLSAILWSSRQL